MPGDVVAVGRVAGHGHAEAVLADVDPAVGGGLLVVGVRRGVLVGGAYDMPELDLGAAVLGVHVERPRGLEHGVLLAPVDLDVAAIRRVVEREGGCIVWGGAVRLSPADDVIIGVERVLDVDAVGQLVASVLSKKIAAGATDLVIDIPVGPTAKVRSAEAADMIGAALSSVAEAFGVRTVVMCGPGIEPIGRGIGPALEARDILAVLRGEPGSEDLAHRACELAGGLLELAGAAAPGSGFARALATLESGRAWAKFERICEAQGGMRVPPTARFKVR